jgi:hypothetical protein
MSHVTSATDLVSTVPVSSDHGHPSIIYPDDDQELEDTEEAPHRLIYIGEYAGLSAYYNPLRQAIMLGEEHGGSFTEEGFLEAPSASSIVEHIQHLMDTAEENDVEYTLSKQAFGLWLAEQLATHGIMPAGQAKAYLLRDLFGVSRQDTAVILGVAPSTVDTQRNEGRQKAANAQLLSETLGLLQSDF